MKTSQKLGLVAFMAFVISYFLPAYGDDSGFACFVVCWTILLGDHTQIFTGGWFYYSGFAISNILFPALVATLLMSKKGRKLGAVVSGVFFLHVLSWSVLHLFDHPSDIAKIKIGYYVWLIAYCLLVMAFVSKQVSNSHKSILATG